jgi:hypothetical protein
MNAQRSKPRSTILRLQRLEDRCVPALVNVGPITVQGRGGEALRSPFVAEFTDSNATGGVGKYSATIDWGDGTTSQASFLSFISDPGPGSNRGGLTFAAVGSHTYAAGGTYTVHVSIQDAAGDLLQVDNTAVIAPPFTRYYATGTGVGQPPEVKVYDAATGALKYDIMAYDPSFRGGVRVTLGDINGDGVDDIVTAAGPGGGPHVKVYDGATGQLADEFFAYAPNFAGGVFVAVGDVNGDGKGDIITGAGAGGGPHVKVFSGANGSVLESFMAYDPSFTGGVTVAAAAMDGPASQFGPTRIITGAGPGGGPHVKVFSGDAPIAIGSFMAYDPSFRGGVTVASGDVNGDGQADLITGAGAGGGPHVKVFDGYDLLVNSGKVTPIASFFADPPSFTGGVSVGAIRFNGSPTADIIVGPGAGTAPLVKVFDGTGTQLTSFTAFDPTNANGVWVG